MIEPSSSNQNHNLSLVEKDENSMDLSLFLSMDNRSLDVCLSFLFANELENLKNIDKNLDKSVERRLQISSLLLKAGWTVSYGKPLILERLAIEKNLKNYLNTKYSYRNLYAFFSNRTLFQIAMFNLDTPLYNFISSLMRPEDVYKQIKEIEEHGISYSISIDSFNLLNTIRDIEHPTPTYPKYSKKTVIITEKHYDWGFKVYKKAVQEYCSYAQRVHDESINFLNMPNGRWIYKKKILENLWNMVCLTQTLYIPPIFQAFCSKVEGSIERSCAYIKREPLSDHPFITISKKIQWPYDSKTRASFEGIHKGNSLNAIAGPPLGTQALLQDLEAMEEIIEARKIELYAKIDKVCSNSLNVAY